MRNMSFGLRMRITIYLFGGLFPHQTTEVTGVSKMLPHLPLNRGKIDEQVEKGGN